MLEVTLKATHKDIIISIGSVKEAYEKPNDLARLQKRMDIKSQQILMNKFFTSHFYKWSVLMSHNRKVKYRLHNICKNTLELRYKNSYDLLFEECLVKHNGVNLSQKPCN